MLLFFSYAKVSVMKTVQGEGGKKQEELLDRKIQDRYVDVSN